MYFESFHSVLMGLLLCVLVENFKSVCHFYYHPTATLLNFQGLKCKTLFGLVDRTWNFLRQKFSDHLMASVYHSCELEKKD